MGGLPKRSDFARVKRKREREKERERERERFGSG